MHSRLVGGLVLLLSILTYIPGYSSPDQFFWDENFHVASAQRYLNKVFFMEPHPPLGKMLIALGELLLTTNERTDHFITLEKAEDPPDGFSFVGYRLVPVVLGSLVAPLIYLILIKITGNISISFLISLCAVFDNALIVHLRGAMLEGPLLFFSLLGIFFYVSKKPLLLGASLACSLLVKVNSAPLLILLFLSRSLKACVSFLIVFFFIWWTHFGLGERVVKTLDNGGLFSASKRLQEAIKIKDLWSPLNLPVAIRDYYRFSVRYQEGVPRLDYCKKNETGSYPLFWPLGGSTIQYRWESAENGNRYLYLVPNPIAWGLGFLGALFSISIIVSQALGFQKPIGNQRFLFILMFIYLSTWLGPLFIPRVFYLYHYFLPLIVSWLMLGIIISQTKLRSGAIYVSILVSIIAAFFIYSPLTYYKPLRNEQVNSRNLLAIWNLKCRSCGSTNPLVSYHKRDKPRTDKSWRLFIGDLSANYIEQEIAEPVQLENGFQVAAKSRVQIPLEKKYQRFSGKVRAVEREAQFRILLDGVEVWSSDILTIESASGDFNIDVRDKAALLLIMTGERSVGVWADLKITR